MKVSWFTRLFQNGTSRTKSDPPSEDSGRRAFLGKGLLAAMGSGLLLGGRESVAADSHKVIGPRMVIEGVGSTTAVEWSPSSDVEAAWAEIKSKASNEELYRVLYALPKGGDIHHHLGGGMLPEMIWDICTDKKRNGGQSFYTRVRISSLDLIDVGHMRDSRNLSGWVTIANHTYDRLDKSVQRDFKPLADLNEREMDAWKKAMFLDHKGEGRDEFFEYIWNRLGDVLTSLDVVKELLVENMKRFGAEGVRYLEIQARYKGWLDAEGNEISPEDSTKIWLDRLEQDDAKETGVLVRFQTIVLRFTPTAEADVEEYFEFTHNNPQLWLGINMAGREDDNRGYPSRFTDVYDRMLAKFPGVGISIHAGEAEKKDTHIFDTLRLGATRIGHGINLYRDAPTMQMMRGSNYLVEINLVSNHLLGYTPDISKHPFPIYMRQGIPCCLNTDDRGMWHSNMTDEYFVAVKNFNLSWNELVTLGENSLKHSFLDDATKAQLLQDYFLDVLSFERRLKFQSIGMITSRAKAVTYEYGKNHLQLNLS